MQAPEQWRRQNDIADGAQPYDQYFFELLHGDYDQNSHQAL